MGTIIRNGISYGGGGGGTSSNDIVELTQAEYDALVEDGTVDPDTVYFITDADYTESSGGGSSASIEVLDTMEEIESNTGEGKAAGALAVKELNKNMGGLSFGVDGDGNYGYYGADGSLIPFKKVDSQVITSYSTCTSSVASISVPLVNESGDVIKRITGNVEVADGGSVVIYLTTGDNGTGSNTVVVSTAAATTFDVELTEEQLATYLYIFARYGGSYLQTGTLKNFTVHY